ncbi:hypothetical protein DFH09DRAFT_1333105 [Mycena vulgaris]|nr:hypothetical protein DFH09DRAFT_1333105 [Mycena vulgaris]
MALITNARVLFKSAPKARWMINPQKESSVPAFTLGEPIVSFGVGLVLRSEHPDVAPGRYISGMAFRIFRGSRYDGLDLSRSTWTMYVGAAGMPGKAAYFGWKEHSHAKKAHRMCWMYEPLNGAGAVGSLIIQLAKRDSLNVIASAGSDEKVKFLRKIGADVAFNYKTTDTREVLAREGPIDVYWDNLGGEVLAAALEHAALYARNAGIYQVITPVIRASRHASCPMYQHTKLI